MDGLDFITDASLKNTVEDSVEYAYLLFKELRKYIETLPEGYEHKEAPGKRVVVAVQKCSYKEEYQLGLKQMVDFFQDQKLISELIAREIFEINDLRNTFHLSKMREKIVCGIPEVERAFGLLVSVIHKAPKDLLKRK
jgi:hypothetical protein